MMDSVDTEHIKENFWFPTIVAFELFCEMAMVGRIVPN